MHLISLWGDLELPSLSFSSFEGNKEFFFLSKQKIKRLLSGGENICTRRMKYERVSIMMIDVCWQVRGFTDAQVLLKTCY